MILGIKGTMFRLNKTYAALYDSYKLLTGSELKPSVQADNGDGPVRDPVADCAGSSEIPEAKRTCVSASKQNDFIAIMMEAELNKI